MVGSQLVYGCQGWSLTKQLLKKSHRHIPVYRAKWSKVAFEGKTIRRDLFSATPIFYASAERRTWKTSSDDYRETTSLISFAKMTTQYAKGWRLTMIEGSRDDTQRHKRWFLETQGWMATSLIGKRWQESSSGRHLSWPDLCGFVCSLIYNNNNNNNVVLTSKKRN